MSIKNKKMKDKKSWIIFRGNNSLFLGSHFPHKVSNTFHKYTVLALDFFSGCWILVLRARKLEKLSY